MVYLTIGLCKATEGSINVKNMREIHELLELDQVSIFIKPQSPDSNRPLNMCGFYSNC